MPAVAVPAALILVGASAGGRTTLAVAIVLLQAVLGLSWLLLLGASIEAAVIVGFAVIAADVVMLRTRTSVGGSVAGVIGLSVLAVLIHQLALRDRQAVTASVAITLSTIGLATAATLLLPLRELPFGRSVLQAAVIGGAVALVGARLVGRRDLVGRLLGLAAGAVAGMLCGLPDGGPSAGAALLTGLAAAAAVLLVDRGLARVADPERSERARRAWSRDFAVVCALTPIVLVSAVAYLAGRIIAGGGG